jgi:hypothetical protein
MKIAKLITIFSLALLAGCTADDDDRFDPDKTPGSNPWNHDDNVTCQTQEDCGDGEMCEDGICRMARCAEPFESKPPLGLNRFFGVDGEVAIISDDTWVDAFEGNGGSYINSWDLAGGGKVIDVAGGNLTGSRPHAVAVAIEFSDKLTVNGSGGIKSLNVGMWPKAIATGDTDGDSIDELAVLAEDGSIKLCDIPENKCFGAKIDGITGKDVTVADIDGDGFAEPIFMIDNGGTTQLIVWNVDAEITGQEESYGWSLNFPARAMAGGDVDGDGVAEIAMLEDGGWWGWVDDKVRVFSPKDEKITYTRNIDGHTMDLAVGDRDADERAELAILREGMKFELLRVNNDNAMVSIGTYPINVGQKATRISMVDWDGDTPSGKLTQGPELIAGKAVPVGALMFPPYPHKMAVGALSANITLGDTESTEESLRDTLSLSVGMGLSFGAEAGIFKAKVGAFIHQTTSYTHISSTRMTIGARYWILAAPELHGTSYAPVITSCGCYHRYQYVTEDPAGLMGGSGKTVDIYVPVGGQTQLWSSKRYNAMAEAVGDLPIIEIPIRVGDVTSYPDKVQALNGEPIAQEDMLFPETPDYQISDVGFVNYWLVVGETETNEVAEQTKLGWQTSFGIGGVEFDYEESAALETGYSISVGTETIFAGGVPPVPDDPETPEDEYEVHRYAFKPFVYKQHYTDAYGEDAAFYVMHFAVSR